MRLWNLGWGTTELARRFAVTTRAIDSKVRRLRVVGHELAARRPRYARPGDVLAAPGRPGGVLAAPGRPSDVLAAPGRPGGVLAAPGRPGGVLAAPGRPGGVLAAPGRPGGMLAAPGRPGDHAPRCCLYCGALFASSHIGNRICPTCLDEGPFSGAIA
jgi:hypothetical protein